MYRKKPSDRNKDDRSEIARVSFCTCACIHYNKFNCISIGLYSLSVQIIKVHVHYIRSNKRVFFLFQNLGASYIIMSDVCEIMLRLFRRSPLDRIK